MVHPLLMRELNLHRCMYTVENIIGKICSAQKAGSILSLISMGPECNPLYKSTA